MKDNNFLLKKLPKNTFEITVTIPKEEIGENQKLVLEEEGKNLEIKGFRKGMAPAQKILSAIGTKKVTELILTRIIAKYYQKAINQFGLKPITSPKVELTDIKEGTDWNIKFTACESPLVELGDYKEKLRGLLSSADPAKIWTPKSGSEKPDTKKATEEREKRLEKAVVWLIENIEIEIGDQLIEEEVNHKLSQLLNETQKLGITIEQYLASTGETIESIKKQYAQKAEKNLKTEFILSKIAESENIQVEPQEIEKTINSIPDTQDKETMKNNKYLIALMIRQQKTLDFLANL